MPPSNTPPVTDEIQALLAELGPETAAPAEPPVSGRLGGGFAQRASRRLVPVATLTGALLVVGVVAVVLTRADSAGLEPSVSTVQDSSGGASRSAGESASALHGDLNGDERIGVGDMKVLTAEWGKNASGADLDKSGDVGTGDLSVLLALWSQDLIP